MSERIRVKATGEVDRVHTIAVYTPDKGTEQLNSPSGYLDELDSISSHEFN
jgi:hypothetical protein